MRRAFSEDGLAVPDDRVTTIHGTSPETGYDATKGLVPLLRTGGLPAAVITTTDAIALGVMQALREHGLRIPEDVSVIGIDDIPQAAHAHPPSDDRGPAQAADGPTGNRNPAAGDRREAAGHCHLDHAQPGSRPPGEFGPGHSIRALIRRVGRDSPASMAVPRDRPAGRCDTDGPRVRRHRGVRGCAVKNIRSSIRFEPNNSNVISNYYMKRIFAFYLQAGC